MEPEQNNFFIGVTPHEALLVLERYAVIYLKDPSAIIDDAKNISNVKSILEVALDRLQDYIDLERNFSLKSQYKIPGQ